MIILNLSFLFLVASSLHQNVLSYNQLECDSLLTFYHAISSPSSLNWSQSSDCCHWEGVSCANAKVTHLLLPSGYLSGTITPFANLSFLRHLNLSHNHFSGPFPLILFHSLNHLRSLDLSFNSLSGPVLQQPHTLPASLQTLDLSSNRFNGSVEPTYFHQASKLTSFNVSNNTFTGIIPPSICRGSPLVKYLDFSMNHFTGHLLPGLGGCPDLQVLRAGSNSLSGLLPNDLFQVPTLKEISLPNNHFSGPIIAGPSNLTKLELHVNEFNGELPPEIGLLSNLENLQLHTNNLSGALPPSLMNCSNLKTLLLNNNHFGGELSTLNFSKLQRLQVIDLGNNSFVGNIPNSLCSGRSQLTAVRLAYNQLVGEIPPCMASLKSLTQLSLTNNHLSNVVGALEILKDCENLAALFLSRCFRDEKMPNNTDLGGFRNLQVLSLAGGGLKGQIPSWIAKLRKLKMLNLSYNKVSGRIPSWLGALPSLYVLNLTQNFLSGELPSELFRLPALVTDNTSSSDSNYLALPFVFRSLEYYRLLNFPPALTVGNNSLSGGIPQEIGQLKLLHVLELNNNNFHGDIPSQLSRLTNLEKLDMSGNHLSGEIPESLTDLHFLSSFSAANNDLGGEIPRGGQFDTFSADSFEGNPKLCGSILNRSCQMVRQDAMTPAAAEREHWNWIKWYTLPFGLGYFVGLFVFVITLLSKSC